MHTVKIRTNQFQPPHFVPAVACLHVNNIGTTDAVVQESKEDLYNYPLYVSNV